MLFSDFILKVEEVASRSFQKTKLFEMAESRSDAEKILRGLNEPIFEHLIKILYWKDSTNYDKHIKDIDSWLLKIDKIKLKPNNKNIKETDIYHWLYDGPFRNGEDYLVKYIEKYMKSYHSLMIQGITKSELYLKLDKIYKELSKDLSKGNFNTIKEYN